MSDYDEIRDVNLVDAKRPIPLLTEVEFLQRIGGKKILLLIHGYNNEEDDVARAYDIIDAKAKQSLNNGSTPYYDLIIGYTWPGGNDPLDYFVAKRRASSVAPRVVRWLEMIQSKSASLDLMCHSMGCRIALLAAKSHPVGLVRNLYLTAAAVDNETVEKGEEYYASTEKCGQVFVFHSKHDSVLAGSFRGAEWDQALGCCGPENPAEIRQTVKVVNCKNVVYKHGGYKDCPQLYAYWQNQLAVGTVPQFSTL